MIGSKKATIIILAFIILFINISIVKSQFSNPVTFNGSYKVKVGDSNQFNIETVRLGNLDYARSSIHLPNGTSIPFNITKGVYIIIEVVELNSSFSTISSAPVLVNESFFIPGKGLLGTTTQPASLFIYPGFDSYSDALSYFKQDSSSFQMYNFSQNENLIIISTKSSTSSSSSSSTLILTSQITYIYNWKTGWLESEHFLSQLSNGTILTELFIQRYSSDVINTILNYSYSIIELSSLGLFVAIPVFFGLSYRSFLKQYRLSNTSHTDQSFSKYFSNKFRYNKKAKQHTTISETDKALQTIESILNESKANE